MAREWTPEEVRLFKENLHKPWPVLLRLFPDRTRNSINNMKVRIARGLRDEKSKRGVNQFTKKSTVPAVVRQSNRLRDRTILAIMNYANDNGLGVDEAARRLLSHA